MAKRTPITATGVALLALIAASTAPAAGVLMLTQAEAGDIVSKGLAVVDTSNTDGDTAAVSLTDAGRAELAKNDPANPANAATASSSFEIDTNVAMPATAARRGRTGGYPFDKLEIGHSFHVAKSADNEDPATRLASSVSGARVRFSEPDGDKTETVTVKTYKRGPDGKGYAKDADGKRIVDTETSETRPVMKLTRDFKVVAVGADDPRGEGARVFRVALA